MNFQQKQILVPFAGTIGIALFVCIVAALTLVRHAPPICSNTLYIGESVKVKKGLDYTSFYNDQCKKRSIVGLQAVDEENLAWVLLEDCAWTNVKHMMGTFKQEELERE